MTQRAMVAVRVKPGARRDHIGGEYPGPYGLAVIISVRARAVDGAATDAARRALAAALGVPPAAVTLRTGQTSRNKLFTVEPAPDGLDELLTALRQDQTRKPSG